LAWALVAVAGADDATYDRAPIHYSTTRPHDAVTRLQARLDAGDAAFAGGDEPLGVLPWLLRALDIPVSSQTLVFSKTSLQQGRISPRNPRALYFNDDTYVGYVPGTRMIEIASTDPRLGTTFYTLDRLSTGSVPKLIRQTDNCLQCHASAMTGDVPGLIVRSVFPDAAGRPILPAGTFLTTHESPLSKRWGGWYVTGTVPAAQMANTLYDDGDPSAPKALSALDPGKQVDSSDFPSPHSDAVALMVLSHQVEAHNRFTRAHYATVLALRDEQVMAAALGEHAADGSHSESTLRRIRGACEPLVEYLLFSGEPPLPGPVAGSSAFAADLSARGPRDAKGRSLRDLDLRTRLFRYPCSYLVYSESFDALPAPARDYVYRRMFDVLTGKVVAKPFDHLTGADRAAILEILGSTKRGLPDYWNGAAGG
jgi:hypothetical protein